MRWRFAASYESTICGLMLYVSFRTAETIGRKRQGRWLGYMLPLTSRSLLIPLPTPLVAASFPEPRPVHTHPPEWNTSPKMARLVWYKSAARHRVRPVADLCV